MKTYTNICESCQASFESIQPRRKFCSFGCYGESKKGRRVGTYGVPGKPGVCEFCSADFINRSSSYSKRFCSSDCYHKSQVGKPVPIPKSLLGGDRARTGRLLRGKKQDPEHIAKRVETARRNLLASTRTCVGCGEEYAPTQPGQKYCSGRCRDRCEKQRKPVSKRFTISRDQYERLFTRQRGKCAICGAEGKIGRPGRLAVDHIHGTERVRGLLCHRCNTAIGLFRDDPVLLTKARRYLARKGWIR